MGDLALERQITHNKKEQFRSAEGHVFKKEQFRSAEGPVLISLLSVSNIRHCKKLFFAVFDRIFLLDNASGYEQPGKCYLGFRATVRNPK